MAILGRRGSSMGRVRQQAAPAQGLKLTPAQVAKMQQEQSRAIMKQPQQPSGLKATGRQATPAEVAALKKQSPNVAPYNEGVAKAFQQFNEQPKAPVAQRTGIAPAPAQKMPGKGLPVAPNSAAQAAAEEQFLGRQAAFHVANMANVNKAPATPQQNVASLQAAKAAVAQQRPNPNMSIPMETMPSAPAAQTPSKAMQSYMAAEKAGTAGNMAKPAFRKGGAVKKKTGYAKGGMAMCGASMPPAQKRKK